MTFVRQELTLEHEDKAMALEAQLAAEGARAGALGKELAALKVYLYSNYISRPAVDRINQTNQSNKKKSNQSK